MGIGTSIFLIATGGDPTLAPCGPEYPASASRRSVWSSLIVGLVGLVLSPIFWSALGSWYPGRSTAVRREDCSDGHCLK